MPVYEYCCTECGKYFEKRCAISNRDEASDCPNCGGQQGRRLMSTFTAVSSSGGELSMLGGGCCGGAGGCACGA